MQYRKFNDKIIARLDKGEEIIKSLSALADAENIKLANVSAIGAVDKFTIGVFKTKEKQYVSNTFSGNYEIVSLTGTISQMNSKPYLHLHMNAADENGNSFGGHLNHAYISATCEMIIDIIDGSSGRKFDPETGLNLFDFE